MKSLHRHDLVWLDPEADVGSFAVDAGQAELVRGWVSQGRPMVVARQCTELADDQIMLGFTIPPLRTRVGVRVHKSAVASTSRPLLLPDAIEFAPDSWRAGMNRVHALCEKTGAVARVYGSLSSQAVTGNDYVDEQSDLDVLLECNLYTEVHELLMALDGLSSTLPRIDGEIFSRTGASVAWRELAAAIRTGMPVLSKTRSEVRMMPVQEFLGCLM